MWGNSLGWGISAVIVIATISGLLWISRTLNTISDPTDFSTRSGAADVISVPTAPPNALTDALPDAAGSTDTLALYHQAIDLYQHNRTIYNEFAQRPNKNDLGAVEPAVKILKQAAGKNSLGIFAASPQEAVTYDSNSPLAALKAVGDCASGAGLLAKAENNKDIALADFQAAFCLGQRMADERLCYAELSDGLGLMGGAAIEMGEMARDAGDEPRADSLNQFATAISVYTTNKLLPVESVLSSIDQATIERNVGDLFWLSRHSKERMWRVEAIHSLGRIKFNAGRPGDNRGASRVLTDIAQTDPDPIIKLSASQARDLTIEQYNVLH